MTYLAINPLPFNLDPIEPARIEAVLHHKLRSIKVIWKEETRSTNTDLLQLAQEGAPGWTVLGAHTQLTGRGRHQRRWISPSGGLYVSLLLRLGIPESPITLIPLTVGLALQDAIQEEARQRNGVIQSRLKWPNDVLTPNGKLAGILCEAIEKDGSWSVIAGVGVNIHPMSEEQKHLILDPVTSLEEEASLDWTRAGLLVAFLRCMVDRFEQWRMKPEIIRSEWLEASQMQGQTIAVRSTKPPLHGTVYGLSEIGGLMLKTEKGMIEINSAETIEEHHG